MHPTREMSYRHLSFKLERFFPSPIARYGASLRGAAHLHIRWAVKALYDLLLLITAITLLPPAHTRVFPYVPCLSRELSVPVTVKIRAQEDDADTLDLVKRLEGAGAQMLTGKIIGLKYTCDILVCLFFWYVRGTHFHWLSHIVMGKVHKSFC